MNGSGQTVSVIIPTYNDSEYLDQAIVSVLSQDSTNTSTCIIIVDSSDDDCVKQVIEKYGPDVHYSWIEPNGVAAARNHGLDLADGDFIGFCDADDYWHSKKLTHQIPALEDGADIVYSDEFIIDDRGKYRLSSPPVKSVKTHHIDYFRSGGVGLRSVLARAECFEAERFDERFKLREDPHLWTRLFAQFKPEKIDCPLSYKRRRTGSITSDVDLAYKMELMEINDLVNRYPELEPYEQERKLRAKREYSKRLLTDTDRSIEARTHLRDILRRGQYDTQTVLFYMITYLPQNNQKIMRTLQHSKWKIAGMVRQLRNSF